MDSAESRTANCRREAGLVTSIVRACDVLEAFRSPAERLRLRDLAVRTGLKMTTAFRIVRTLESRGFVERIGKHLYRTTIPRRKCRKFRIGYAAQSAEFAYTRALTDSIARHAEEADVDLITLNNRYSPRIALRNADQLIREKVDLILEGQTDENIAPLISGKFQKAGIPVIALHIPHPGATYYGVDNYNAGRVTGRSVARWARDHWEGRAEEILLVTLGAAGAAPRARQEGALAGMHRILPCLCTCRTVWLDGNGQFGRTLEVVRHHLRTTPAQRTLVAVVNEPTALGVLHAFQEAGRYSYCAVAGQGASVEGRMELRRPGTRLVCTVGYFPERTGRGAIRLALDVLANKPLPPAVFTPHRLITRDNVDQYYPQDAFQPSENPENLVFHRS